MLAESIHRPEITQNRLNGGTSISPSRLQLSAAAVVKEKVSAGFPVGYE